tara:strand:- start:420 stop:527 length:108 start_codon:yes stop_codon:yes gene_type:complete
MPMGKNKKPMVKKAPPKKKMPAKRKPASGNYSRGY